MATERRKDETQQNSFTSSSYHKIQNLENEGIHDTSICIRGRHDSGETVNKEPVCNIGNALKTGATYIAYFGRGMGVSVVGATVLQLQQQTGSTTGQIASVFAWTALGSLFGNGIVGLLFERTPPELLLGVACLLLAAGMASVPFCSVLWTLMAVSVVNGTGQGILGGGCNCYLLKHWKLKSAPYLQALHFIMSLGSSISPLIVDGFLSDQDTSFLQVDTPPPHGYISNGSESNGETSFISNISNKDDSINGLDYNLTLNGSHTSIHTSDNLLYPYLLTTICLMVASLAYVAIFSVDLYTFHGTNVGRRGSFLKQKKEDQGPIHHKAIVGMLSIYLLIYGGLEISYGSWILTFCFEYGNFSFEHAAQITSLYWASLAVGRAISIIIVKLVSVEYLSCICLLVGVVAFLIETIACTYHPMVMWICTVVIGLSFAPQFGNCITYSQQELNTNSSLTTLYVFFLYLGLIILPAFVGFMFANYTPMFFLYILSAGSVIMTVLFIGVVFYMNITRHTRRNNM